MRSGVGGGGAVGKTKARAVVAKAKASARPSLPTGLPGYADGNGKYGAFVASGSPVIAEICAHMYDFICIDMEHSPIGFETVGDLLRACDAAGTPALVRVAANDTVLLKRTLDMGPAGVIVPMARPPPRLIVSL